MKIITGITLVLLVLIIVYILKKKKTKNKDIIINKSIINHGLESKKVKSRITESKLQTLSTEKIAGFSGTEVKSPNKKYSIQFCDGDYKNPRWEYGNTALIFEKQLNFKKKLIRPNNCKVSDNGTVLCCDWLNTDSLSGKFYIFDEVGNQIFETTTQANLGICEISTNSEIAIFETYNADSIDGDKIFIIDIIEKKIKSKIDKPISFKSATINTDNQRINLITNNDFDFEIDYNGNQTNRKEYDKLILEKGSIYDILFLYEGISDDLKLTDENYLRTLIKAIDDDIASNAFGVDIIYRRIGEYYEANNNIPKTIEYWEKAFIINPKIGVKRKLNKYKAEIK